MTDKPQPSVPVSGRNRNRNRRLAAILGLMSLGMVGMSFAAVPLYRLFCQITGYGGTTQVAEQAPDMVKERTLKIRFDANVNPGLPWTFRPEQLEVEVKVGESGLVFYMARNEAAVPTAGMATFNVTPLKAGQFFNKVACFCFDQQVLQPGEQVDMGVSFFIDPAIMNDRNLDDVNTITLSYTFFADPDANLADQAAVVQGEAVQGDAGGR